ncbi:Citramalyl-CoA lyase, mitochondrial [Geodia barretti]|uniref:Citramalyl-CoA lyase, mitochondrial n=1 Tax=Geodia barretti TaxID=519541 RepID=A0AA35S3U8_GEOBA|nr:Citramalyl-CoA lyase, mitochondrial [Geodia barretti]
MPVIHPAQVPVVQEAFSPSEERVEWASRLISAFNHHQHSGQGAFVYEGHMIDRPLLLQAQNIVSLHGNQSSNK